MATISLKKIFLVFLKIGTLSFGGVYSMLAFFERELVERRKWLTHEEFIESIAIGQMTPGPPIVNTGICIGYRLRGIKGALAATVGQSFTGSVLAILLAIFYIKNRDNVLLNSAMKGVGAAVIGLLLSIILKMAKSTIRDYKTALFALAAFFALILFKLNPIGLILASGALGFVVYGRSI
ncbi:MAG: chromate transporter [Dissulfurimicrobium sp.]|uniref:chromate transporter n=1 Tax=Dissulfurimicrobium TaxID=1769732 RepID=UPI001EDB3243|nr:chromate transporter [Dissulfurimicrobium hydrothermale]UKL13691.1 chromate transporter [Dissulfurimicrobium hydrothermale]